MSVFGSFFGGSNNNQQQAAGGQGSQPAAKVDDTNNPAATAVKDGKMPGTEQLPVNPLDAYTKLWENADKTPEAPPAFALDPEVLGKVSGSLNFTQGIDPELMQKATSGDANAMLQIINVVGQQSYKAALSHTSALTDKFVNTRSDFDAKKLGSQVKSELTDTHLMSDVPGATHPAVRSELKRIAQAMQKENPDASPVQIAQAAKDYFGNIYSAMNPQPTDQQRQQQSGEVDWDTYFK